MNSIMMRRQSIINRIVHTIKEVSREKKEIDWNLFELQICEEYGCTIRKAREYIAIGKLKHGAG